MILPTSDDVTLKCLRVLYILKTKKNSTYGEFLNVG